MTSDKINNQNKEYTAEQYNEDCRLVYFTYLKYFKGFPNYREDLIQSAFLNLCIYRDKFDSEKYNYSTFVVTYAYYGMLSFFRQKRKYDNNDFFISLEKPLASDETSCLADLIVDDNMLDITAGFDLPYIEKCIANAIDYCCSAHYKPFNEMRSKNKMRIINSRKKGYNQKRKQIILEWLKIHNFTEVAKKFGLTRECMRVYCEKFKTALKNELARTGYYE